jgi:hypothetical protein
MSHMVIYRSVEGQPVFHQVESLEDAARHVETLRNAGQGGDARIFSMKEVKIEVKTYYRVEVASEEDKPAAAPAPAAAAPAPAGRPGRRDARSGRPRGAGGRQARAGRRRCRCGRQRRSLRPLRQGLAAGVSRSPRPSAGRRPRRRR